MKVKGLANKIQMINPNSVSCGAGEFDKLKEGHTVDLEKNDAEQLLNMGVVEAVKTKSKEKK